MGKYQNNIRSRLQSSPTNSSVVFKIADIKQQENESVLDYVRRGMDTIKDLKSKIDSARFVLVARHGQRNQ